MTRTSSISVTFVYRQRSPVSVAAASSLSAAFLAPLIGTIPDSGRPPSIRNTSLATGSGLYSQWNGFAAAILRCAASAAVPRPFAVSALRDADPEECLLELGSGGGQVDGVRRRGSLESAFRLAAGFLGHLEVDLACQVRGLGHHDDAVRPDLEEPAGDRERLLRAALPDPQLPDAEHRDEGRVMRQDPELAFDAGELDRIDRVRIRQALRGHDLEQERHGSAGQLRRVLANVVERAGQEEGLLRQRVGLAVEDLLERGDGVLDVHVLAGSAREHLGHEERLAHEALEPAGAC